VGQDGGQQPAGKLLIFTTSNAAAKLNKGIGLVDSRIFMGLQPMKLDASLRTSGRRCAEMPPP